MRIIISPAKKMNVDVDSLDFIDVPVFLKESNMIKEWMQSLSFAELKELWGCNEKLARQNYERLKNMNLESWLTPAILAYEGIQYQYMAPSVFEDKMLSYVQDNLRILSGFYGVLKPMDGVVTYRLEMQAKTSIGEVKGLYNFWGNKLSNGRIVQKGTYAKMARGEMVRFMAENNISDLEEIKAFDRLGYKFSKEKSTDREYVFVKKK